MSLRSKNQNPLPAVKLWRFWKQSLGLAFIIILASGCASSGRVAHSSLPDKSYSSGSRDKKAPKKKRSRRDSAQNPNSGSSQAHKAGKTSKRMIIYRASLGLRVADPADTVNKISSKTKQWQGYVQKSRVNREKGSAYMILRVPVEQFHSIMDKLSKMGTVFRRSIRAQDITEQYSDLKLRLQSARHSLARYKRLLKSVSKTKERVKILKEINRLQKKIGRMRRMKEYYARQAAYSTIRVKLRSTRKKMKRISLPSPFPWIADLRPTRRTLPDNDGFELKRPEMFFSNQEKFFKGKASYIFVSPQATKVRTARVANYPLAKDEFWHKAVTLELINRGYQLIEESQINQDLAAQRFLFQVPGTNRAAFYELCLAVIKDNIYLLEIYYPNQKALNKNKKSIHKMMAQAELP